MGIRNIVIGYCLTDKAKILENLVYNHLLYRDYTVRIGYLDNSYEGFHREKSEQSLSAFYL